MRAAMTLTLAFFASCGTDPSPQQVWQPNWIPAAQPPRSVLAFVVDDERSKASRTALSDFPVAFALLDDHTFVQRVRTPDGYEYRRALLPGDVCATALHDTRAAIEALDVANRVHVPPDSCRRVIAVRSDDAWATLALWQSVEPGAEFDSDEQGRPFERSGQSDELFARERGWSPQYRTFRAGWRTSLEAFEALADRARTASAPFARDELRMERIGLLER